MAAPPHQPLGRQDNRHCTAVRITLAGTFSGLSGRLGLMMAVATFILGGTLAWLLANSIRDELYCELAERARRLACGAAAEATEPLARGDRPALERLCDRIARENAGVRLSIFAAEPAGAAAGYPPRKDAPSQADPIAGDTRPHVYVRGRGLSRQVEVTCAIASVPVGSAHSSGGCVHLVADGTPVRAAVQRLRRAAAWFVSVSAMAAFAIGWAIGSWLARPLRRLCRVVEQFAAGNLEPRIGVVGPAEIAELCRCFNTMGDRLGAWRAAMLGLTAELERKMEERARELEDLAARDPLTNVYNRRHFTAALSHEFAEAIRYDQDVSLLMVDLDNFKRINDTQGHRIGDEVLLLTARTISNSLRAADIVARYGGDEFIALLPHTSAEEAEVLGNRIREAIRESAADRLPGVPVDVSIGIAGLRETAALSPEVLIQEVDKALYTVKRTGKGRIARAGRDTAAGVSAGL